MCTTPQAPYPAILWDTKIAQAYLPLMRPIVSQTLSILSPTASFVDHALQPLAQSYADYLHNSTALSQDLQVPDNAILVTIDVVSLYPFNPAVRVSHGTLSTMKCATTPTFWFSTLILSFNFFKSTSTISDFTFQGTAMGAPFSQTIANIFISIDNHQGVPTETGHQPPHPGVVHR